MHIAAVLEVTLLNIPESARFKKGAFRIWGCLPEPFAAAAENEGTPESKIEGTPESIRATEVHQAGLSIGESPSPIPAFHVTVPWHSLPPPTPSHSDRDTTLTHRRQATVAAAVATAVVAAAAASAAAVAAAPAWARTCVIRCWFYVLCCLPGLLHVTLLSISRGSLVQLLRFPVTVIVYTSCW